VNSFHPLQRTFLRDCRKANGSRDARPPGGIDTPSSHAYIFPGSFGMPSTPFGEHLKREREMRGVSLEEVSAATRISTRFLEAIENEKWDELPGGVFNRGFIRAIARFLGLDEDGLVAEYALETKGAHDVSAAPEHPAEIPRNWQPAVFAVIGIVLLVLAGWFVYHRYGARIAARFHRRTSEVPHSALGIFLAGTDPEDQAQIVLGGSH
jgi:transcriptional regulator with XRE-family HTH domain